MSLVSKLNDGMHIVTLTFNVTAQSSLQKLSCIIELLTCINICSRDLLSFDEISFFPMVSPVEFYGEGFLIPMKNYTSYWK